MATGKKPIAKKPAAKGGVSTYETPATRGKAKKIAAAEARKVPGAPAGRGVSIAAAKKNTAGTVTRGKGNVVIDSLRRAANAGTLNVEKAKIRNYRKLMK